MSNKEKLYIAVTADAYELPICVADSMKESAHLLDADYSAVTKLIKKGAKSRKGYKCYAVEIDAEEKQNHKIA